MAGGLGSAAGEGLLKLAEQDVALGRAQPVHEEDAVQVVQLVLEDAGQEILPLDLDGALAGGVYVIDTTSPIGDTFATCRLTPRRVARYLPPRP